MTVEADKRVSAEKSGTSFFIDGDPFVSSLMLSRLPGKGKPKMPEVIFVTHQGQSENLTEFLNQKLGAGSATRESDLCVKLEDRNKLQDAMVQLGWPGLVKQEIQTQADKVWPELERLEQVYERTTCRRA